MSGKEEEEEEELLLIASNTDEEAGGEGETPFLTRLLSGLITIRPGAAATTKLFFRASAATFSHFS
jgi:hypothetical protein